MCDITKEDAKALVDYIIHLEKILEFEGYSTGDKFTIDVSNAFDKLMKIVGE